MEINKKLLLSLTAFCLLSLSPGNIVKAESGDINNDYDSLIVKPSAKSMKLRRHESLMNRYGLIKYRSVNNNLVLVSLDTADEKQKLRRIEQLKSSGLFDIVEPNYKLAFDDIPNKKKNYISVSRDPNYMSANTSTVVETPTAPQEEEPVVDVSTNDPSFNSQYYLRDINATKAWSIAMNNNQILVAVLDTGIKADHPDLAGKVLGGDQNDEVGHGTEVAGIIGANSNNNLGIAGISWNTKTVAIKVTDDDGQARVSTVVSAFDKAYQSGAKIIQISLSTNQFSYSLRDAVKQAQDRGILVIASAGNSGVNELRYPASFDGVIGVGAVDKTKNVEDYSTKGTGVSIVAPGTDILTTSVDSKYSAVTGTSFSTPQVSGTAALILSVAPSLNSSQLRDILLKSADDLGSKGRDDNYGYGLLNAKKAVEMAKALAE